VWLKTEKTHTNAAQKNVCGFFANQRQFVDKKLFIYLFILFTNLFMMVMIIIL